MKGATYYESVMTNWDISFVRLGTNAVKIITLFGFLGRNQISIPFLEHALNDSRFWGGEGVLQISGRLKKFFAFLNIPDDVYESIGVLDSLSLVTRDASQRQIYVHPMIHEYIHLRMPTDEAVDWLVNVVALLSHQLPPLMYSSSCDKEAPLKAEQVFFHLDRTADLAELYRQSLGNLKPPDASSLF